MTLQQLKYMIMIAEKGSITEAAKELYISQPSLSGAIKDVEKEVKITIFNRCRAGVALTTEGILVQICACLDVRPVYKYCYWGQCSRTARLLQ